MKLFLDTNVFVEFIEHRKQYEPVSLIIDAIIEEEPRRVESLNRAGREAELGG